MKRVLASVGLAVLCAVSPLVPTFAQSEEDPVTTAALLPIRFAGLSLGMAVGIPASTIRQTAQNVPKNTMAIADGFGGQEDAVSVLFAVLPGIASGVLQGVAEGCYYGTKNAIDNCVDRPFGAGSFGLGENAD